MKHLILFIIQTSIILLGNAQTDRYESTYSCTDGVTHFFSSTPLEDIESTSNQTICVLNTETKKVYAKVSMKSFNFEMKLMQEHFNENYVESDKYPHAILDAVIANDIDFKSDGTHEVLLKGTFEVHGVKQEREIKGKLTVKDGQPQNAKADFDVKLEDHKIKTPKAVLTKIAEVIKVDVNLTFEKYQKK